MDDYDLDDEYSDMDYELEASSSERRMLQEGDFDGLPEGKAAYLK